MSTVAASGKELPVIKLKSIDSMVCGVDSSQDHPKLSFATYGLSTTFLLQTYFDYSHLYILLALHFSCR